MRVRRILVCLIAVAPLAGCATPRPGGPLPPPRTSPAAAVARPDVVPEESLETSIAKVRVLAASARPSQVRARTVEATDPRLAAALLRLLSMPTAASHRLVAAEYRRLGVLDAAHEHLARAVRLDPSDAAAYDGLARIWRDWGFPHLGLGDAHRAVFRAPDSPVAQNTLGTILLALGQGREARARFERASLLDPRASYALNNLCYALLLEADSNGAIIACRRALDLAPNLVAARNNLGLAYALDGDMDAAAQAFEAAGDRASADYNLGIVNLARHCFAEAATAFETAARLRPSFALARQRARQARRLSPAVDEESWDVCR